jgi:hypothetical protein
MFTEQDIDDLCHEPDNKLAKHAGTIVAAIRRARRRKEAAPTMTARTYAERVRCGRCLHFAFNPTTPATGLGHCPVRPELPMTLPARLIECDHYQQRAPAP